MHRENRGKNVYICETKLHSYSNKKIIRKQRGLVHEGYEGELFDGQLLKELGAKIDIFCAIEFHCNYIRNHIVLGKKKGITLVVLFFLLKTRTGG